MEKLKIKAFGAVAEKLPESEFDFPPCTDTENFLEQLHKMNPALQEMKFSLAVNKKLVHENTVLNGGEEIALLPAFSGG